MTYWYFSILNFPNSHILHCKSCLFTHHYSLISLPQKQHIMPDTLTFTSVHTIPGTHVSVARSLQGGAQHRTNHYQQQDEVHPVGRRQSDAVQYH